MTITTRAREALACALASWGKVQSAIAREMGEEAATGLRRLAARYAGVPAGP